MRKTLALLVASTALTAAAGLPAWSALRTPSDGAIRSPGTVADHGQDAPPIVLASDDDDDDDRRFLRASRNGDDEDDDDDCDDDDDDCRGGAGNPAPAGTVAPPRNGLFGNGAPPRVGVNRF